MRLDNHKRNNLGIGVGPLLRRSPFTSIPIEIRVDANGAFSESDALEKLKRLSDYELHSIEQPISAGQYDAMAELCAATPLSIALDEELIGIHDVTKQKQLLFGHRNLGYHEGHGVQNHDPQ